MTRSNALAKMAERKAEAYATGNHSASFADTYDKRAFEAGFTAAVELLLPVIDLIGTFDPTAEQLGKEMARLDFKLKGDE